MSRPVSHSKQQRLEELSRKKAMGQATPEEKAEIIAIARDIRREMPAEEESSLARDLKLLREKHGL